MATTFMIFGDPVIYHLRTYITKIYLYLFSMYQVIQAQAVYPFYPLFGSHFAFERVT